MPVSGQIWDLFRTAAAAVSAFSEDRRGNIAVITAFTLPVLVGAGGLGVEVSNWYRTQSAMQNAADSAALAAAANGGFNYDVEAKAVAALYGFKDGEDYVSVAATDAAPCPTGGSGCYRVEISGSVPLFLSRVVGYAGTEGQDGRTAISANAVAARAAREYCVLALAGSGVSEGIRTNGAPKASLGCNVMSNTGARCNGHDLGVPYGDAHGTNDGCGAVPTSGVPKVKDPYADLADNIPSDPCSGSYSQMPSKKKDPELPTSNQWSGAKALSGNTTICGDLQLTDDVSIDASSGAVLVIQNGRLDTNGFTLSTSDGSALTIVFAGSNAGGYIHAPTGGGMLDIAAPATGDWKGVALYQAPNLTSGVDISEAGNEPAWNITGLVYLPHASVVLSGAVNKASNGDSCFALVVDNLTINGTGNILARDECAEAGLDLPAGSGSSRTKLVG